MGITVLKNYCLEKIRFERRMLENLSGNLYDKAQSAAD
jgi:hypothetical protein